METNTDVIVQARMGATRLPGKVLLPFFDTTVLGYLLRRLKKSAEATRVLVATTENPLDDAIEQFCNSKGHACMRGSEHDVLARFLKAADIMKSDVVVRVTADNPFTDIEAMDELIRMRENENLDYIGNHQLNMPSGLGSEVMTVEALRIAAKEAVATDEREHVTPYFYRNRNRFRQKQVNGIDIPPHARESYRLTLDTREDYEMLMTLGRAWEGNLEDITTKDLLSILEKHPEIAGMNQQVEQKKVTS